jgi:hypothetical protein
MLELPGNFTYRIGGGSDARKKLQIELFVMNRWSQYDNSTMTYFQSSLIYKPINSVSISLSPEFFTAQDNLQYVTTIEGDKPDNYIMGHLDSKQFSLSARINVGITPDMSIQYYGQPFFFSGDYSQFKTITNPVANLYNDRFHEYTKDEIQNDSEAGIYTVDTDGNDAGFSFDDPDFHFLQYRSNLVYRWEYKPGSTIFLVWSQGKTAEGPEGTFMFDQYANELRDAYPQNDFLIKISYAIIF